MTTATEPDLDALIREEYASAPALTAFSRQPIPYDSAADSGMRSAYQAEVRALIRYRRNTREKGKP